MYDFDLVGCVFLMAALVSILTLAVAYYGYKFLHEPAVIDWMARHGIVEIEEEDEER